MTEKTSQVQYAMTFDELLDLVRCPGSPRVRTDSRLVGQGDIFVAVQGSAFDGHDFIDQALADGARYVVCQSHKPGRPICDAAAGIILVEGSAGAAAALAQAGYGNPASGLTNLAVTGTNGKTTVAFLVRSCIEKADQKCGLIGTVTYDTGAAARDAVLTTPDCLAIAEMQAQMLKAGSRYMVIEASSHALAQNRLAGIDFKAAAFTNLSGDHLDYHKTEQDYLAAKSRLFEGLSPDATAVLNAESPHAASLAGKTKARVLWYGIDHDADLSARIESIDTSGAVFVLYQQSPGGGRFVLGCRLRPGNDSRWPVRSKGGAGPAGKGRLGRRLLCIYRLCPHR
jgi:UDP-N-acetylmuramoyl-L-alanyl-D-glutamate--2,6-diaminopimelate ligase